MNDFKPIINIINMPQDQDRKFAFECEACLVPNDNDSP